MEFVRKVTTELSEGSMKIATLPFGRSNTTSLDNLGNSSHSKSGTSRSPTTIGRPMRRGRRKSGGLNLQKDAKSASDRPALRRSNTAPIPTNVLQSVEPDLMMTGFECTETTTINSADELQHVIMALALNSKQQQENKDVQRDLMNDSSIDSAVVMVKQFWRLINEQQPQEAYALIEDDVQDIERNWDAIAAKLGKGTSEEETKEEEPVRRPRRRSRLSPFKLGRNFTK